jgi:hypothetical protein
VCLQPGGDVSRVPRVVGCGWRYISQIQLCLATGISVGRQSRLDASPEGGGVHDG